MSILGKILKLGKLGKVLSFVMALAMLCALIPVVATPVFAQSNSLSIDADTVTPGIQSVRKVTAGDSFSVDVIVNTSVMSRGGQCGLKFTPGVISCTGVTNPIQAGFFYKDWVDANDPTATVFQLGSFTVDNAKGTVALVGLAILGGTQTTQGPQGSGKLFTYNFTANSNGVVCFTIEGGEVTDVGGTALPLAVNNGALLVGVDAGVVICPFYREVSVGQNFNVTALVVVNPALQSRGAQCGLSFAPGVVACNSVTEGTFYSDFAATIPGAGTAMTPNPAVINNAAGTVGITLVFVTDGTPNNTGTNGFGSLFTYNFTALNNGLTTFCPTTVEVVDQTGMVVLGTSGICGDGKVGTGTAQPDLTVTSKSEAWVPGQEGVNYNVTYTVKNQGPLAAAASTARIDIDGGAQTANDAVPLLGFDQTFTNTVGPFAFSGPTDTVLVTADFGGVVAESNESNNSLSNQFAPGMPDLEVISKSEAWIVSGDTYSVTYTIQNTGGAAAVASTARIENDNTVPDVINDPVPALAAGASYTNTVGPFNFEGSLDNITVTADVLNVVIEETVGGEANNVLTNQLTYLAGVEVEITPAAATAHPSTVSELVNPSVSYDPVTLQVAVTNTGLLNDKYELTVAGPPGWSVKVDPCEFYVLSGDTMYAALSVTVPPDTYGDITEMITVTAEGKMATDGGVVIGPTDSDSAAVTTGIIRSVQMDVLPGTSEPQSGAPGSPICWLIVVKNTGNMLDTFTLGQSQVLENVSGNTHTSWTAVWNGVSSFLLDPFKKGTTQICVTVPLDSKTSEWLNLTVGVSGAIGGYDEVTVQAHVMEPGPMIPENVLELTADVEVVAMSCLGEHWFDFGIIGENETKWTPTDEFTVRNIGNVPFNVLGKGVDAQSQPGEPTARWELEISPAMNIYALGIHPSVPGLYGGVVSSLLDDVYTGLWTGVPEGAEVDYGAAIAAPTIITTPARMWTRILLIVVATP